MFGDLIVNEHLIQHYRTLFNRKTGFFVREEEDNFPEPSWAMDGPELIDLSITNYCERGCRFCYRETRLQEAQYLSLADVKMIVEQAVVCGTMQIALGGGNPNQHPQFVEILKAIREKGIIPSYTTNGDGLSDEILKATSLYCGAMAISFYPPYDEKRYESLLQRVKAFGITLNLHVIIKNDTLNMWRKWLETPPAFIQYINAIIFLNYKPVQEGGYVIDKESVRLFFEAVNKCSRVKIGFDSCSISGISRWMDTPAYLVEPCEAARFSAFISEDMKMYPCSFMIGRGYCGDLRKNTLLDVWQENEYFKRFRNNDAPERCSGCGYYKDCKGGCRLFPDINFC